MTDYQSFSPSLNRRAGLELALLLLWTGGLLLIGSPQQSLMAHDEGWYALQARWIVETGDWLTPQWWGDPVYDRTIGLQWLIAVCYRLFGVSEAAARLPGVVSCLATVGLTYAIGRQCLPPKTAFVGAAILAVTPIWMQSSRLATQDVPLTAVELLGIWALLRAETVGKKPNVARFGRRSRLEISPRWLWGVLAGTTVGLAFMLKSIMVVPVAIALAPYLLLDHRRHRHLLNPGLYLGLLLGFLPFALWFGLSLQRYGTLPAQQLFGHLFSLSQSAFHSAGPLYYFWNIPANAFPWPLLALVGAAIALRQPHYQRRWLLLAYPAILFAELTLFKTRTWYYPLQLLPFVALLAAVALVALARQYARFRGTAIGLTVGLAGLGLILVGLGLALGLRPGLLGLAPVYGWLGLAGLGWLVPLGVYWRDRLTGKRSPELWLAGWLLGPWIAIAAAYGTGLWGNYAADLKQQVAAAPLTEPVHLVSPTEVSAQDHKTMVLLSFYSPQLGQTLAQVSDLPVGEAAWVPAALAAPETYTTLATVRDWALVERRLPQGRKPKLEAAQKQA